MSIILSNKPFITIRETIPGDFQTLHEIRMSVKENALSNPSLVTEADYTYFMTVKGKGWLAEIDHAVAAFAIIDCLEQNIWALFVRPGFDKMGIGKRLHDTMLDWYFASRNTQLWLGTSPNTRAEHFYRIAGWKENGMHNREIRFTMSLADWKNRTSSSQQFF